MRNIPARFMLSAYRGLGTLLTPCVSPYLALRAARGKEDRRRLRERMGRTDKHRPEGPLIWLHAASVGETMALMPMIEKILSFRIHILLTTGTIASAQLVETRFGKRLIHQYVPLDLASAMRRFLDHWKPDLALVCESEIWPMRIVELDRRKIPQILLNAHLSERSFHSWQKHKQVARDIFSRFSAVICQSEEDSARYKELGAQRVCVSGNLKADVELPQSPEILRKYRAAIGARPTWAAISTHDGEELMAVRVHKILLKRYPDLLTIIVPRHIERMPAIEETLRVQGCSYVRRSLNDLPQPQTDILLGDTIGEMGLYLRLTEIAFVGKSLTAAGGHNPLEPALIGTAILSGPNIENFRETYRKLKENAAVQLVDDSTMLAGCVHHLLEHPETRRKMIEAGRKTASGMTGALKRSFEILKPFLQPLTVSAQLNLAREDSHGQ